MVPYEITPPLTPYHVVTDTSLNPRDSGEVLFRRDLSPAHVTAFDQAPTLSPLVGGSSCSHVSGTPLYEIFASETPPMLSPFGALQGAQQFCLNISVNRSSARYGRRKQLGNVKYMRATTLF